MGKIFVKGPVESPDDLLAKQTMAQRLKDFVTTRNIRGAGEKTEDFAGNIVGSRYGAKDGGRFLGDLFSIPLALLRRRPKTPEEEEHARQMIRIAQQDRIREQMRPARETRAYQELYERYGLKPQDVKQIYGKLSPEDALNQERIVQQGLGREQRRNVLRGQQGGEKSQATQTADEIATAGRDPMAEITAQGQQLIRNKKIDDLNQELLAPLNDEQKVQIQTSVEQLREDMGEIPELGHGQGAKQQDALHAEMEKNNQNMDPLPTPGAGVQRGMPDQEDEGEGEGESQMRLIPPDAFGFGKTQQEPRNLADIVDEEEGF